MSALIKTDPLFNSIRNEPEFQQIVKDIEAKYQAEHERVKKWMEEQGSFSFRLSQLKQQAPGDPRAIIFYILSLFQ